MSRAVTEVTHNHPEGIKGAEATAGAYYGVPTDIRTKAESFLDPFLLETLNRFEVVFSRS